MVTYNVYAYVKGRCVYSTNNVNAPPYIPAVGTYVETQGMTFRVEQVVYMPEYFRTDIKLSPCVEQVRLRR